MTSKHKVPEKGYTGIWNTELNTRGIHASSDVPTYNAKHSINIYTYVILVTN